MTAPNKMAKRAAAGTLALAVCFTGGLVAATTATAAPGFKFDQRISGADRTATAIAAAEAAFGKGSDTVIIVERDAVVDGLTASYAAGLAKAPILYVDRQGVPDQVTAEIKKLGATKAILVGGKAVLPQAVEDQLKSANLTVTRQSGPDRYATAAAVALSGSKTPDKVLVASGEVPADALAAGPVAYAKNYPLVLVRPDSVPDSSRDALDKLGSGERLAIGGTVRISASVYDSLGQTKRRVSGANRQLTAIEIAKIATGELGFNKDRVALVSDADRAAVDALVASPVAGSNLAPLLFTSGSNIGGDTEKYLKDNAAALTGPGYIFGGTAAVPQSAADQGTTAAGGDDTKPPTTGNQKYSFSGSAGATVVSLANDDPTTTADERTQGNVQYRVTGLGDAPVNVVLVDPDSVKVDANGQVTFLSTGTTGRADLTAAAAGYISVLNGVATGTTNKTAANITPIGGALNLTVNSTTPGNLIPVVFSNADKNAVLELNSTTTGSTVYGAPTGDFGIGAQVNYQAAAATTGNYDSTGTSAADDLSELTVTSVDTASKTFQATYTRGDATTAVAQSGTFNYGVAGSQYVNAGQQTPLSQEQFASFLGKGDVLDVNYNATGPSNFVFTTDVPAAATGVTAVVNDLDNNGTIDSIKVTFTPAPNLSATGYQVQRATVSTAGVTGAFTNIGSVIGRNAAKEYVDATAVAGTNYKYRVVTQPGSPTTTQSMASDPVKAPTSAIQGAVAGPPTLLDVRATETGGGNFQVGVGDSLQVVFNEPVTVPNGSAFRLSDGVNSGTVTVDGTNATVLALPAGTYNGQAVVAGQAYRIRILTALTNPTPAASAVGYPAAIVASTAGVVDLDEGNTLSLASGDRTVDVSAFSPAYSTTAPIITSGSYNAATRTATFTSDVAISPSTVDTTDFAVATGTGAAVTKTVTSATVSNGGLTVSVVLSEAGAFGTGNTVTSTNSGLSTIDGVAGTGTSVVTG